MLELKITITADDALINALTKIAAAVEKTIGSTPNATNQSVIPATPVPTTPAQYTAPAPATMPPNTTAANQALAAPVQPQPAMPAVPTAAPQYTLEMLAVAGSSLIDAGKATELSALLVKYGVDSLVNLAPANYGAVAAELRALGARL